VEWRHHQCRSFSGRETIDIQPSSLKGQVQLYKIALIHYIPIVIPLKMVIFHSYVSLPEGIHYIPMIFLICADFFSPPFFRHLWRDVQHLVNPAWSSQPGLDKYHESYDFPISSMIFPWFSHDFPRVIHIINPTMIIANGVVLFRSC